MIQDINKKKSTLKDVASKAGVTAQTVSNYLNKNTYISDKTKKKIKKAIIELEYTPNIFARGLRIGKSKIIGVIIPEIGHPFFSAIMFGIEEIAKKEDYTIVFAYSDYNNNIILKELEKLSNYVDGIILCTNEVNEKIIKRIIKKGVPIVAVDIKIKDDSIPSVQVNNYNAIKNGIQYLINAGHKNIYYLSEPLILGISKDRLDAYKDCLRDNSISLDENKIILDKGLEIQKTQVGYRIVKELLKVIKPQSAIFATSDLIIIGAMKATVESGYKIPDDISFLGNEDIFLSEFTNPPLSSIRHPKKEMGRVAMKLLLDLISGEEPQEKRIFLKTSLIKRATVKDINKKIKI